MMTKALMSLAGVMVLILVGCETPAPEVVVIYPPDSGGTQADLSPEVGFEQDIKPMLKTHCYGCHSDVSEVTPFSLSSYEAFTEANGQHQLVVPGEPERSGLFLVTVLPEHYVEAMPADLGAGHTLEEKDVWLLYNWILQDGEWPKGEAGRL
jgi:hypothetical protein